MGMGSVSEGTTGWNLQWVGLQVNSQLLNVWYIFKWTEVFITHYLCKACVMGTLTGSCVQKPVSTTMCKTIHSTVDKHWMRISVLGKQKACEPVFFSAKAQLLSNGKICCQTDVLKIFIQFMQILSLAQLKSCVLQVYVILKDWCYCTKQQSPTTLK